jgi:hypothetical protein
MICSFYINLPLGGLSAAILIFFFKAPPAARPVKATLREKFLQMDLLGTFTIMAAVVCFLLAIQWGGVKKPWSDPDVIGTLVGFGILVLIFIAIEWRTGERALIQPHFFKDRNILVMCVYAFFIFGPMLILIYYLPIYFQSIKHVSAAQSGVRNLPFILGVSLFTIASGGLITVYGHFVPLMVIGSAISTVGAGLICTFRIDTGAGKWIGYQVVAGIGSGLAVQIPVIVNQASVGPSDLSSISSVTLFLASMGGSFWVSAAQSAFANKLLRVLPTMAPGVDPLLVIATGATELDQVFSPADLPGILMAYMDGLQVTFIAATVLAGITLVISVFPKWESIKEKLKAGGMV